jgi:hypothetical protein
VALLRFRVESTHESVAVPKLNVVAINELFGRFNGRGIVRVIVQKFGSNEIEIPVDTDDVGAIVRQCCRSLDQAGAQNSQSPIKAAGGSVMGAVNSLYVWLSTKFKRGHFTFSKGTIRLVRGWKGASTPTGRQSRQ